MDGSQLIAQILN